ncbi:DsbA family protein [Rhodococcus sp. OK302]|uniref:DsbA family protein n=1 Tax=Rhodococcus sp. OK302 TaxID=1882769 RepID=UPI000B94108E|nr:thioredoxin domain-containing protein [Rhodococcus sp. OK302]OYD69808.1 protein-disulfide isomerase [Rhodococcus sp. OK302]
MGATRKKPGIRREFWLIGILAVVAVVLGTVLVIGNNGEEKSGALTPPVVAMVGPAGDHSRRISGDPLAIGSVDAPVVLVEYSDYRCPFCAKFSRDTEPALIEKYVNDGVLRMEWRDLPIFGEQSTAAARAGRAAAAQGKFWEYNSALYSQAPDRGHPDLTAATLNDIAAKAGVPDLQRFEADAASSKFDESISRDMYEARMIGISSTPSFIVNGTPVLGAQPLTTFEQVIDRAAGL